MNKQSEAWVEDLSKLNNKFEQETQAVKHKLQEAEENNKSIVNQNQKLNDELWEIKKDKAQQNR